MDPKKSKEVPLPTKFLVVTQVAGDGATARFTFQPAGDDDLPIELPAGTPALAFEASSPSLHLQPDMRDTTGLSVIGKPLFPGEEVDGITVTGQTTLPGTDTPLIGESEPINILYGPTGPKRHHLAMDETEEEKAAREKAKADAKARGEKAKSSRAGKPEKAVA